MNNMVKRTESNNIIRLTFFRDFVFTHNRHGGDEIIRSGVQVFILWPYILSIHETPANNAMDEFASDRQCCCYYFSLKNDE